MSEIERVIRYLSRERFIGMIPVKVAGVHQVKVLIRIGSKGNDAERLERFPFPMMQKEYLLISKSTGDEASLPQIDKTPLNTQTRRSISAAKSKVVAAPSINTNAANTDDRGVF